MGASLLCIFYGIVFILSVYTFQRSDRQREEDQREEGFKTVSLAPL